MKIMLLKEQPIEIWTFEEFVEYGRISSIEPHATWEFKGAQVTQEHNGLYLIPLEKCILRFHDDEVLCIRDENSISCLRNGFRSMFTLMKVDLPNALDDRVEEIFRINH